MNRENDIAICIKSALDGYFHDLDGHKAVNVYDLVLNSVEKPMLEYIITVCEGNQNKAANILGISRNTLRKKLSLHQLTHPKHD